MDLLWPIARAFGDLLVAPFLWLPPVWALLTLSFGTGLLLLVAFRWLTPQRALRRTKEQMGATLYEMRVFSTAPGIVLLAQGRAVLYTLRYLALALPSLIVLGPIVALMVTRASLPFEQRQLAVGESAVLSIELDRPVSRARLQIGHRGKGLRVVPPILHLSHGRSIVARVQAVSVGSHRLTIRIDGKPAAHKRVLVSIPSLAPSPVVARAGDPRLLLSDEQALQPGPIGRVELDYPRHTLTVIGMPWWLCLLLLSLAIALLFRRRLGVVF